jgi:hypothetical protein
MGLGCVWGSCQSREDIWTEKFVDDDSWRTMCYSIRTFSYSKWEYLSNMEVFSTKNICKNGSVKSVSI